MKWELILNTRIMLILMLLNSYSVLSFGESKPRFPIWTFNTVNTNIYGASVGFVHKEKIENVTTNGIRLELFGLLNFKTDVINQNFFLCDSLYQSIKKVKTKETVNGINISPFGHICDCSINGINFTPSVSNVRESRGISFASFNSAIKHEGIQLSIFGNDTYNFSGVQLSFMNANFNNLSGTQIALFLNVSNKLNGTQISLFNAAQELYGLQTGLVNSTRKIRGLQIGLININEKRILPIINW